MSPNQDGGSTAVAAAAAAAAANLVNLEKPFNTNETSVTADSSGTPQIGKNTFY